MTRKQRNAFSVNICGVIGLFLRILLLNSHIAHGLNPWWSSVAQLAAHHSPDLVYLASGQPLCVQLPGLSPGQARVCELFMDHMPAVGRGARQAIEECQRLFQDRMWNCSTPYGSGVFGPVHVLGTREAAFTYAMVSAGVAHEIGRSCRNGVLDTCGCGQDQRPVNLHPDWMWGGCSDDLDYGYQFAQNFIDVREREHNFPKRSIEYGRALMNRWNNKVGRRVIRRKAKIHCKCHGVSGSCNLKTCWKQLAGITDVGNMLLEKYDEAVRVKINNRGNMQVLHRRRSKRAPQNDLVYLDESPNYCQLDPKTGALGTRGRICRRERHAFDSCNALCCGRGYRQFTQRVTDKCDCKFQWCCKVVCKTCTQEVTTQVCN